MSHDYRVFALYVKQIPQFVANRGLIDARAKECLLAISDVFYYVDDILNERRAELRDIGSPVTLAQMAEVIDAIEGADPKVLRETGALLRDRRPFQALAEMVIVSGLEPVFCVFYSAFMSLSSTKAGKLSAANRAISFLAAQSLDEIYKGCASESTPQGLPPIFGGPRTHGIAN